MAMATFDTHRTVKALAEAGFNEPQAEALVTAIDHARAEHSDLATKSDLDARFSAMDEKWESRLIAMDEKWDERFTAMSERLIAMDEKWDERFTAMSERLIAMDEKWGSRLTAMDEKWDARLDAHRYRTPLTTAGAVLVGLGLWQIIVALFG